MPGIKYAPNAPQAPADPNASITSQAIHTASSQPQEGIRVALEVLRTASDIVTKSAQQHAAVPAATDTLEQALRQAMLQRLTENPFDTFLKIKQLLQPPATNSVKDTLELITALRNSGLFPTPRNGSGLIDLGREVLPHDR